MTKITSLKQEKETKDKELAKLKEQVKEVDQYEKDNQILVEKTKVIEQLKKNQKGPVRIIDELSKKIPSGVWFESVVDKSGIITLNGNAFSNGSLVTFVQNLKSSEFMEDVNLLESKKVLIDDVTVYKFVLNFKVKV
jgi:type IV pilus assembly protein PilN